MVLLESYSLTYFQHPISNLKLEQLFIIINSISGTFKVRCNCILSPSSKERT